MNDMMLTYALVIGMALPFGLYMAKSLGDQRSYLDRFFSPIEGVIYRLAGVNPEVSMPWQAYATAVLKLHVLLILLAWLTFMFQGRLPLNPDGIAGMRWDTALHTAISFATNTNQQHYSGQAELSHLSQTLAIVTLQFLTPATGMAVLVAIARTLLAKHRQESGLGVGNYYRDLTRSSVRILLPLAAVVALLLTWQGVPANYQAAHEITPLDAQVEETQRIPLGPVSAMVAIKPLGTNGGGWYGPNSSVPLENPTAISNVIETAAIMLIPVALLVALAVMTGRHRLMVGIGGVMLAFSLVSTGLVVSSERMPNAAFAELSAPGGNMEGKEVRFGTDMSALWGSWTTQTSNGSVNAMHDSFNPLGGMVLIMDMLVNVTFGGVGVGLIGFLLYLMLAAFIGSLMVGRAPELFGHPLETREIRWISLAILAQPLIILGLSALAVSLPGVHGTTNPTHHGLAQVIYEYTSAFANNGSGFEGLDDATYWWNLTCAIALLIGRFLPMLVPLAVASWLATKRTAPAGRGTLALDSGAFMALTAGVIVIINLLGFLPALVLGPVAEALVLAQ
ncbi:potassium-transporting ATPase subunit KdpA [Halomonas alkalicola]|uniref:Potassium-transporting ATPase potassium-binding subunit n=1 Tax=Halomonas alkalicola TaxID=1930622 RepID=A0ABY9H784_9GAMM|nr:potassium-transporting ATPase subunit KdpA [Halomonas alkalicola]WLI74354.1 potassium-transporting ATPase subunit KdpA [Halomonas alkalicola]